MADNVKENHTVVLFGDSTTAPRGELKIYENYLRENIPDKKFINAGVPGDTTELARERFEKDVLSYNPDIVVIQFGINDSAVDVWKDPPETQPRVNIDRYRSNLQFFIDELKNRGIDVVIMSPNKCCWTDELKKLYGKWPYDIDDDDGFNVNLVKYVKVVREIARDNKIPFVDIYAEYENYANQKGKRIEDLLLDGMHPNEKGHKLVAQCLMKIIE